MSGKMAELVEHSWVLQFPTDILTMLLTQWMTLIDISHLDRCVSHLLIRKKFLDIISADSTVYSSPTAKSIGDIHFYSWLYYRNISVRSIKTAYYMDEKLPLYLQEKVCRHIKRLDFSSGASHSYLDLPNVLSFCPKLEELLLCENSQASVVDDAAVDVIVEYSKNLRVFELRNSRTFDHSSLLKLVIGCSKLTELHFPYCYEVCDECLLYISHHCTQLKKLTVRTNEAITNSGVMRIVQHCTQLTHLVVPTCSHVTNTGIVDMMPHCKKLQHLDLSVLAIQDTALEAIAQNCADLRSLVLKSCGGVTNTGVVVVVERCTKMTWLDVTYCRKLVDIKVVVGKINPALTILTKEDDSMMQIL